MQQRSSFAINDRWQIIGDAKDSQETARWIFVVLIGSEIYSIVTYLLSENPDDDNSDCCTSAVVTKSCSQPVMEEKNKNKNKKIDGSYLFVFRHYKRIPLKWKLLGILQPDIKNNPPFKGNGNDG